MPVPAARSALVPAVVAVPVEEASSSSQPALVPADSTTRPRTEPPPVSAEGRARDTQCAAPPVDVAKDERRIVEVAPEDPQRGARAAVGPHAPAPWVEPYGAGAVHPRGAGRHPGRREGRERAALRRRRVLLMRAEHEVMDGEGQGVPCVESG